MTRWEYRFVELFHRPEYAGKEPPITRATHLVTDELDEAGHDGWEAVGQVTILSGSISHPVILMKRPIHKGDHHDHDD